MRPLRSLYTFTLTWRSVQKIECPCTDSTLAPECMVECFHFILGDSAFVWDCVRSRFAFDKFYVYGLRKYPSMVAKETLFDLKEGLT